MRVTLEYVDPLYIEGLESGDMIRVQEGIIVADFLDKLELDGYNPERIKPLVNGDKASDSWNLEDGDQIKLIPEE